MVSNPIEKTIMMTHSKIGEYVAAEPFRPFRIKMASEQSFEIRHPEMLKILKSCVLVFKTDDETSDFTDGWESVSLKLTESASHLEAAAK